LALFKHQSAKVLGVVVSSWEKALIGKDKTNRTSDSVARGRVAEKARGIT
jgi:hypothetical protein